MITPELINAVKAEASALRKHGEPEELANINFRDLDPFNNSMCIYGMATGDCFNDRATELFQKCAKPWSASNMELQKAGVECFDDIENGEQRAGTAYSAIEFYITQEGAKLIELTEYLAGRSNKLPL